MKILFQGYICGYYIVVYNNGITLKLESEEVFINNYKDI